MSQEILNNESAIDLPAGVFDIDYGNDEFERAPLDRHEKAKQIAVKVYNYLQTLQPEGKKRIVESFDDFYYVNCPTSDQEEASLLLINIYKELLLMEVSAE